MDLNKVTIIGHVVRDPQQCRSARGMRFVQFTVATLSAWRDPGSKKRCESVDFHDVLAVGPLGKIVKQYVPKATKVYVEGRLHNQVCKRRDGTTYTTRVIMLEQLIRLGGHPPKQRVPEDVDLPPRAEPRLDESGTSDGEGAVR